MPDKRQNALAALGGAAAGAIALYLGAGIMQRATGEYVKLPDRMDAVEAKAEKVSDWMGEMKAEQKALREAAAAKAQEDERRAMWKDRTDSERKRDERLEKILAAIAECNRKDAPAGRKEER